MLTCNECGRELPEENFYANRTAYPHRGFDTKCKECRRRYISEWRKTVSPLKARGVDRRISRDRHLQKKYGLSPGEYDAMLLAQGSVCGICRREQRGDRHLAVDHNHETGEIRGLLCNPCNAALGLFDDGELFEAAIEYLRQSHLHVSVDDPGYPGRC
jgi:Autographiviridae endonuclease VII